MKKILIALSLVLAGVNSQAQNWAVDQVHSNVAFTVSHMMVSDADGNFKNFDVNMTSAKPDFSDAKISATIKVSSVNTGNENRDAHLQKDDFFDAAKYENITFESTSVKSLGAGKLSVSGKLTMHGVTKNVTFVAAYKTGTNAMSKKTIAGFKINGKLNRKDYGVGASTGSAIVGDEVNFRINLEMVKD